MRKTSAYNTSQIAEESEFVKGSREMGVHLIGAYTCRLDLNRLIVIFGYVVAHLSLLLHGSLGYPKVTRTVIKKGGWMEWSKKNFKSSAADRSVRAIVMSPAGLFVYVRLCMDKIAVDRKANRLTDDSLEIMLK